MIVILERLTFYSVCGTIIIGIISVYQHNPELFAFNLRVMLFLVVVNAICCFKK